MVTVAVLAGVERVVPDSVHGTMTPTTSVRPSPVARPGLHLITVMVRYAIRPSLEPR